MSTLYTLVETERGHWFIGRDADDIWFWDPLNSKGLDGHFKMFEIEPNLFARRKGPWASNADALFADTGIKIGELGSSPPQRTDALKSREPK